MDAVDSTTAERRSGETAAARRPARNAESPLRRHLDAYGHLYLATGTMALFLALWALTSVLGLVHNIVLPPPSEVATAIVQLLRSEVFPKNFQVTVFEIFAGFVIGLVSGLALGTLLAIFPLVRSMLYPYVVAFQALPKIVFAPLFVTWFGFGPESKIATAVGICFFPVFINTLVGLQLVPESSLTLMRSLRANAWQVFRMVRFPNALPYIFAGIQTSLTLAMTGAIAAEFITGAQNGLGKLAQVYGLQLETGLQFAVVIVVSVLGLLAVLVSDWIDRRVIFWREDTTTRLRRGELGADRGGV
ncbi:MAG: ABC transporter permease [Chloroflexi bacterium]|nr:ABC transporter permease [Chloroflexota bacterium]